MSKEIYISSTPHETRLAIVESDELTEIYYERENEYTLAGSIYNGKVTRVLPGMQSSFVDIGLERDAFLYITDFMEEAGETADFDTAEGRGKSDNRRGERPREPQRTEAAAAPEVDRAPAEAAEPRGEGRGRRRRGGNRDRSAQPRELQGDAPQNGSPAQLPEYNEASFASPASYTEPAADADLGEGAPGADGSRRWRGRRGRRRGRGGLAPREGVPALNSGQGDDQLPVEAAELGPDPSAGYDLEEDDLSFDASAAPAPAEPSPSPAIGDSAYADQEPRSGDREPRADRGRGDRGGRDRGRDRGGRGDRSVRAPRGFAPRSSFYGVDGAEEAESVAGAEPIILPGESLSKYRQGGDTQFPAQGSSAAPAPSAPAPEFSLPGAWDGGNVLPGETLRPRTASPEARSYDAPRREGGGRRDDRRRGDSRDDRRGDGRRNDRGSERSHDRDAEPRRDLATNPAPGSPAGLTGDSEDRSASHAIPANAPLQLESAAPQAQATPLADAHHGDLQAVAPVEQYEDGPAVATPPQAREIVAEASPEPAATTPVHAEQSVVPGDHVPPAETHEAPAEYEPTDASASFRVDPTPPREFRQPAPDAAPADEPETPTSFSSLTHSITPQAGEPIAPLHSEEVPFAASEHTEAPPSHDVTSITPEGEMLSELPPAPVEASIAEPTSPLQHETVIHDSVTDDLAAASTPAPVLHPESTHSAEPQAYPEAAVEDFSSPAEIQLEETEEDEVEDFHSTTLHAASIEEMDYDEEERFETAADIGSMIRDMSIDQITRPPAADSAEHAEEDDDFAFEEEDSTDLFFQAPALEAQGRSDDHAAQDTDSDEFDDAPAPREADAASAVPGQEGESREGRRSGRRDNRRGGRDRGGDRFRSGGEGGDRTPSSGGSSQRHGGGRREGHRSAQTTNLPAISDLLKPGQEVLVQIAKEPIAKKGARITSHIALPGRFLVFMPTVNHTGVSRKIESDGERRRLKEILLSEKGEASGGFIVRTAAAGATEEELRSDLRFLLNLWADIKQRSESSKSPALIYHDLNLVERILRDQVTDNFSAIWVDTETDYERILRFLQRFQPSLIRRVKLYTKETPLFEQFGVSEEINKALRSKVWLKSGGSIVINQTEALVAIDINTGKYVGKTARLEDTIVKTNLDAIPEIVRQIRLRDLGGIIIIDFIDMDERKNRHKVMAVLEEELKKDRAPSKVLQFNDFGLVAITRKRVKQSLERTLSTPCNICTGTGMVKSPITVCNDIYIEMRKMQKHLDRGDVMLRVNPEVVKQLKSPQARWLQEMEEMVGKTILVKSDPTLHPEQFDIH